jgi:erythromycin esterase
MTTKTKRVLCAGVLLVGLTAAFLWLLGVRAGHVRFLILSLSEPATLSTEDTAELHRWLRENAVHLRTVAAGSGFEDMQPLKALVGDARIVALGEAAHMNRDFSRVKHRMIEFLVEEMGFRVVALEAAFAGALELNHYILTGDGTPEDALAALVYPAWRTEEVLDLVRWLRRYNAAHEEKVRFYGFDNKPADRSAAAVRDYLRATNGTRDYDQLFETLVRLCITLRSWKGPSQELRDAMERIKSLIAHLESQRPIVARSSTEQNIQAQRQWALAVQHARVLLQNAEFLSAPSISRATDLRDRSMARNVKWLMDYEKPAKAILWAANAHLTTTPGSGAMGDYLRRTYGDDMVVFGLLCHRQSQGNEPADLSPGDTEEASGAPNGSVEALLAAAGLDIAVVDLRSLPKGPVWAYFHTARQTGAMTSLLPWAYDAILFIESTTNARPMGTTTPRLNPKPSS